MKKNPNFKVNKNLQEVNKAYLIKGNNHVSHDTKCTDKNETIFRRAKKIQPNSSLTLNPNVPLLMLTWAAKPM